MPFGSSVPRILMVNPWTPPSWWGFNNAVRRFAGSKVVLPPLGLITVAAMLPQGWRFRVIDENDRPLKDRHIRWADVVLVSGMLIQRKSMQTVLERCREFGKTTVVGGPFVTEEPDAPELRLASTIVTGEVEGDITYDGQRVPFMRMLAAEIQMHISTEGAYVLKQKYAAPPCPDLTSSPTPRWDLLNAHRYHALAIQLSRGCPHGCEFCDVIMLNGRTPRYKTHEQIEAELDAMWKSGHRGSWMFVDDNFIGNKRLAKEHLRMIARWQNRHRHPVTRNHRVQFYSQVDIRLAEDDDLLQLMTRAGFFAVFIGIETPNLESLKETGKGQNLRVDLVEAVKHIQQEGLIVYAGMIVGFDHDGPEIFDQLMDFLDATDITFAMIGMLMALPGTRLYDRLKAEGRLLGEHDSMGDPFELPNFRPKRMTMLELVRGYRGLLQWAFNPERYFQASLKSVGRWNQRSKRTVTWREYHAVLRSYFWQGWVCGYRRVYKSFMRQVIIHHRKKYARGLAEAIAGHHFFDYTQNEVVPRLLRAEDILREQEEAGEDSMEEHILRLVRSDNA